VEVIDADLSTVTAQVDKVFRIPGAIPWLLHLEFQASRDPYLWRRVLKYNALLHERHGLPVHSVVVLLRREADDPKLTGGVQYRPAPGLGSMDFRFQVVRVLEGVRGMKESSTYQAILAEGEAKGAAKGAVMAHKHTLLTLGSQRFGQPDERTRAHLAAMTDVEQLERLIGRLLIAGSWEELLAGP
jgi:hypothetical protein